MQNQHAPVLIFAQSARFLAQSATQAGFTVWVADCFGDTDTIAASQRWLQLPALSELAETQFVETINEITQGQHCILICGSGIEVFADFLAHLPSNVDYLGNSIDTIKTIKTPQTFFKLLKTLNISYPQTCFNKPEHLSNWISKSAKGMGGIHIQSMKTLTHTQSDSYFQHYISGVSCSALFLSSKESLHILSINKQIVNPSTEAPFRLGRIEMPLDFPEATLQTLHSTIEKLVHELQLIGLNSIDFIYTATDQLLTLEVNPRPSASMELVTTEHPIIELHINACMNKLNLNRLTNSSSFKSLAYFYADRDYLIPNNMVWPEACSDLASHGKIINCGEPICSCLVECHQSESEKVHLMNKQKILSQLLPIT